MKTNKLTLFTVFYFVIVITTIISSSVKEIAMLHYFAKPAILTSLIIFFIKKCNGLSKFTILITLGALIFSLLGDILLMFDNDSPMFFIGGLAAFLIAHIMYVFVFLKRKNNTRNPTIIGITLFIYGAILLYILKDGLGEMLAPVLVYMVIILTMAVSAYLRKGNVTIRSYLLVFLGAVNFIISDSILALNKFVEPLWHSNITIMLTYGLAQYLIIRGILSQNY
jgi:uncharacterized membrane protein YhhN